MKIKTPIEVNDSRNCYEIERSNTNYNINREKFIFVFSTVCSTSVTLIFIIE